MITLTFLLLWCTVFALLGALVGSMSGLMPGLHPNTMAAIFAGFPQLLAFFAAPGQFGSDGSPAILFGCFLIGVLMAHSLTEIIPTAMLGVADEETIAALLPSQRLFQLGRADLVIESVVIGGIGAVIMFAILFIPTRLIMGQPIALYSGLKPFMGALLIVVSALVLLSSRKTGRLTASSMLFAASGMIGIIVLTIQLPTTISDCLFGDFWVVDSSSFLLPAFSGMFAIPSLVFASGRRIEPSASSPGEDIRIPRVRPLLRSIIPSVLVGWIPGITNAYATSLSMARRQARGHAVESACLYLVTYSATNVGGSLQSILAMAVIFRSRNGTLDAIGDHFAKYALGWFDALQPPSAIIAFLWSSCIATVIGAGICMLLGRRILNGGRDRSHVFVRFIVLVLISILVIVLSGPIGFLILLSCFLLGSWALSKGAPRVHLMGFLLVPVIVYFILH